MTVLYIFAADAELGNLPAEKSLAGVGVFNPTEQEDSSNIVARLMSELKGKSEYPIAAPSMAATGEGLPSLPKRCVKKILAGEFIDFAELPPAKGKVKSIPHAMEGQIVVIQAADLAESRKLIPDLATWIQCFSIYAAVIITKEPERAKNLLAYMSLIAKCSLKYKWRSWVVYDLNFRQDAAEVGQKDWSKVEPSTYTQCFTGAAISQESWCRRCHSIDHASDACPIKPTGMQRKREGQPLGAAFAPKKRPAPHSNPQVCRKYNTYDGDCRYGANCMLQHKCESCGEQGHPAPRCPKGKKENM